MMLYAMINICVYVYDSVANSIASVKMREECIWLYLICVVFYIIIIYVYTLQIHDTCKMLFINYIQNKKYISKGYMCDRGQGRKYMI